MKIRTKLILLSVVFAVLVIAIGSIMLLAFRQVNKEIETAHSGHDILKHVFELNIVTYEYFIHHGKRMQRQWGLKYDSLGKLLSDWMWKEEKEGPSERLFIIKSIISDYKALGDLFSNLQANLMNRKGLVKNKAPKEDIDLTFALEERLAAQALMRAQEIVTRAYEFTELAEREITRVQQKSYLIVLSCIIGFLLFSSYILFLVVKGIAGPIRELTKGAEIFGRGNLRYRVNLNTKDETGILAAAFNEMAAKREQAEEAISRAKMRLEYLLTSSPAVIYVCRPSGDFGATFISENIVSQTGYKPREFTEDPSFWTDHIHPEDSPHVFDGLSALFEKGRHAHEYRFQYKDGTYRWMHDELYLARDSDGNPVEIIGSWTDIHDRKLAEEALRTAQKQLIRKEKLAILGQLAGGVSHELRNPLGAIKNASYFLKMVLENPEPEVKETLEILEREVETSNRTITSLLDFTRARAPSRDHVGLNTLVEEALSRVSIPDDIEVVKQLQEPVPDIFADQDQILQVFGNIIFNGIQAMSDSGRLTITSKIEGQDWIAVSFTDTGKGIPKEKLEEVFEPLFTTKARGIGLGLAISKMFIEQHGGTIRVESGVGKGSTFTVRLPTKN